MGFQKFQKSEEMENVTEEEKQVIDDHLQRTSKAAVSDMTEEEKNSLNEDLQEKKNA